MVEQALWQQQNLAAGIDRLTQLSGFYSAATQSRQLVEPADIPLYVEARGLEAMATQAPFGELAQTLGRLVPGILGVELQGQMNYLLITARRRKQLKLLLPDGDVCWCDIAQLIAWLGDAYGYVASEQNRAMLQELGVSGKRLESTLKLLVHQQYALKPVHRLWLLRPAASQGLRVAMQQTHWQGLATGFVLAHIAQRLTLMAGVGLLGYAIARSLWSSSLVMVWLLLMLSLWGFSLVARLCQAQLEVRVGLQVKRQLQHSALQLSPAALASKGPTRLLGQVLEADGLQHNALPGAFSALNAVLDILLGLGLALVLQQWLLAILLFAVLVIGGCWVMNYHRAYAVWTFVRKQISELTIEAMQGHRTRLMQSNPELLHREEEQLLQEYWGVSVAMDKHTYRLQALLPGLWLIGSSALLCIAIMFALLPMMSLVALLGIILLAWQALDRIASSAQQLVRSWHSWREIQDLLQQDNNSAQTNKDSVPATETRAELNIHQLHYGYTGNRPLLQGVSMHLQQGQQYLLQGESGSGKSTLLSLLAGQARSRQGWILYNDRDLPSLGYRQWRQKICWVPQYHDNYLFSATLLFNLLLGRQWPPEPQDIERAYEVCDKLGLTPLLQKMPGGILQSVGEMGWQLSQGERSRVFLARALLQQPDFLLLDESLGALDSATSLQILSKLKDERAAVLLCMHP